jgi:hypothetical protein
MADPKPPSRNVEYVTDPDILETLQADSDERASQEQQRQQEAAGFLRSPAPPADFVPPPRARTNSFAEIKDSHESTTPRFWTNQFNAGFGFKTDPKFKYRFRVIFPGLTMEDDRQESTFQGKRFGADDPFFDRVAEHDAYVWWVKTISKPKLNYQAEEEKFTTVDKLLSKRSSATPILEDITMTMIDPSYPNATRKLARIVRRTGYNEKKAKEIINDSYGGSIANSMLDTINGIDRRGVQIHQLDEFGAPIETWTLRNAFIKRIDFGELDYSSDELLEISLTLGYEAVKVSFPKYGREEAYPYFDNPPDQSKEEKRPSNAKQREACERRFNFGVKMKQIADGTKIENWAEGLADPRDPCKRLFSSTEDEDEDKTPMVEEAADDPTVQSPTGTEGGNQQPDPDFNPDDPITVIL